MMAAFFPATAQADIFEGSTTDATGETTPARDIAAISARYDDRAGEVAISVQLAAPADQATDALLAATLSRGLRREHARGLRDHAGGVDRRLSDRQLPPRSR